MAVTHGDLSPRENSLHITTKRVKFQTIIVESETTCGNGFLIRFRKTRNYQDKCCEVNERHNCDNMK
jgi:hypothetical protein